jgi:hypothetical protein
MAGRRSSPCDRRPAFLTQEQEATNRHKMAKLFSEYQGWIADEKRMCMLKETGCYMGCQPCERGHEAADIVLDDPSGVRPVVTRPRT